MTSELSVEAAAANTRGTIRLSGRLVEDGSAVTVVVAGSAGALLGAQV